MLKYKTNVTGLATAVALSALRCGERNHALRYCNAFILIFGDIHIQSLAIYSCTYLLYANLLLFAIMSSQTHFALIGQITTVFNSLVMVFMNTFMIAIRLWVSALCLMVGAVLLTISYLA